MTAPAQEPGTAVTAKKDLIGSLPAHLQAAYALKQMDRNIHAAIAGETWGKKLDTDTRKAIAAYCQKYGIDVVEIDVLGGNLYRNARFYLARLAALQQAGLIEYAYADHIGTDPRLVAMADNDADPETRQIAAVELRRRKMARVEYAVPEAAQVAVVFRVKMKDSTREIAACKWIAANPENDPVGKTKPVETCESRAARRCLRMLIPNIPAGHRDEYARMEADYEVLETKVAPRLAAAEGADPEKPEAINVNGVAFRPAGGGTPLATGGYDEPKKESED